MTTKLDTLKQAAAANDWRNAVAIAARFPRLGAIRDAVLDAHTAYTNPRWTTGLGKCPQAAKDAGRHALIAAYKLTA